AKALYQREQNGEKLSADDQAYLDKAKAARGGGGGANAPQAKPNPDAAGIDWERAKTLYQREQNGEKLSAEDQAYLDKAKAARGQGGDRQQGSPPPRGGANIDWDRARKLHEQEQRGEKLSADDQAYLDKAKEAVRSGQGPGGQPNNNKGNDPGAPSAGGKTSVDITPLTDLAKGEKYKDQDGGLYG